MDIQDQRRKALQQWLDAHGGHAKVVADRRLSASQASYLSQVTNGYSFAERAARNMEERLGMPPMYLDRQTSADPTITYSKIEAMEPTRSHPPDLASAIPVVVRALAATPSMQFGKVISALESLDEHPEEADKVSTKVHSLLSSPARRKQVA